MEIKEIKAKPWNKKWWGILTIIVAGLFLAIITAFAFYIFSIIKIIPDQETADINLNLLNAPYDEQARKTIEGQESYWMGSAKPKITIVEFADFACPYCQKSFGKIREIGLKYGKDVKIIFRNYPMHENSLEPAMAARCAGEQGLFWLMHDKLFLNQSAAENPDLAEFANQIGADLNKFNSCMADGKYLALIKKDAADGEELGVGGTPTWFINGNKIEGDIPYELFIQIIKKAIQE